MRIQTIGSIKQHGEYLEIGSIIDIDDVTGLALLTSGAARALPAASEPLPAAVPAPSRSFGASIPAFPAPNPHPAAPARQAEPPKTKGKGKPK